VSEICFSIGEHIYKLHFGQHGKPQQLGKENGTPSRGQTRSETADEEKRDTPPSVTAG